MSNTKTTKRALFSAVVAMFSCIAMLVGATFAWFTDSASTAVNKIQAGTLDVALEMATSWSSDGTPIDWDTAEGQTLRWMTADGRGDDLILWEPGCTYNLNQFRIVNNGNFALKYKIVISGIVGDAQLLEAIDFTVTGVDGAETADALNGFEGKLAASSMTGVITISGHMKEEAGNDYQGLSIDGIGITVVATQDTVEYDSEDNQYDENAGYSVSVKTQADLDNALNSDGAVKITIEKDANVEISDVDFVGKNAGTTVANYGTLTVRGSTIYSTDADAQGRHAITNYGTLTVENSTLGSLQSRGNAIRNYGTATIKNSALTCCDNYLNGGYAYVFANSAGTMTIENCSYTGAANGVFAADGGNIIINGGTYKLNGASSFYMFYMWEGTITVNGGTFEKSGNSRGMAYATDGVINDQFTINGGTFTYNGAEWSLS